MSNIHPDTYNIPAAQRRGKLAKYRPSLTAAQLTRLEALLKEQASSPNFSGFSATDLELLTILGKLTAKIQAGVQTAAYVAAPAQTEAEKQQSTLASLGGANLSEAEVRVSTVAGYDTKEEYWAACYAKYSQSVASCNPQEIEAAMEHMYLEELMTPEQVTAWESKI